MVCLNTNKFVTGLHASYDGSRPPNQRVLNVTIRCIECDVPVYEPIQLDKYYRMVSHNFLGNGGDGFSVSVSHTDTHTLPSSVKTEGIILRFLTAFWIFSIVIKFVFKCSAWIKNIIIYL